MASRVTRMSAPWQLACTITALSIPRTECSLCNCSKGASGGQYGASAAKGNFAAGPKTWQCASQASGGGRNSGLRVFGSGAAVVFLMLQGVVDPRHDLLGHQLHRALAELRVDVVHSRVDELAEVAHLLAQRQELV